MILSKEKDAVLQFKNSCIKQGKALESGNYKEGNKSAKYNVSSTNILYNKVSCLSFAISTVCTRMDGFFGK